jgi:hypothetical protein
MMAMMDFFEALDLGPKAKANQNPARLVEQVSADAFLYLTCLTGHYRKVFQAPSRSGDAERPNKMHLRTGVARLWLIILTCTSSVLASAGDRSEFFQNCIPVCWTTSKANARSPSSSASPGGRVPTNASTSACDSSPITLSRNSSLSCSIMGSGRLFGMRGCRSLPRSRFRC